MVATEPEMPGVWSRPFTRGRMSLGRWALLSAFGAIGLLLLALSAARMLDLVASMLATGDDFTPYWTGATAVAAGQSPYGWLAENRPQEVRDYIYPPLLALLLAPLTPLMDYPTARWAWLGFSLLCTILGLALVWRTSGLTAHGPSALALLPFLALLPPTMGALGFGQLSPQLFLATAAAYAALRRKRSGTAGALVALAAGLKSFPAVIGLYLLMRRQWCGCLAALAVAMLVAAWSMLVLGPGTLWTYLTAVIPAQRPWLAAMSNVSFTGLFTRLFSANLFAVPVVVADGVAQGAIAVCSVAVLSISGYAIWRARRDWRGESAAFGVAVAAALLVSPINGTQNLLIAALPLAVAAAAVQAEWPRHLRWLLLVMLLLSLPVEYCDLAPLRDWCLTEPSGLPIQAMPWRQGWGNLLTAGPLAGLLVLWGLLVALCLEPGVCRAPTRADRRHRERRSASAL
ncbi:MAG TPA: glycosyltransferase family 87 protein [Chloroflexota bacterium]|nr:glycosyltransferase family 87 protein [Chloroflexota bacterium]